MDNLKNLFALVVDKQQSFIDYRVSTLFSSKPEVVSSLGDVGRVGLFDSTPTPYLLPLDSKEDIQRCVQQLKKLDEQGIKEKAPQGLAITTTVSRNSTRGLEKAVKDLGGSVLLARKNSKDRNSPGALMLEELNLKKEVKHFLLEYAGVNYERITPILSGLSKLPKDKQIGVSVESIDARLPKPPGALEPWDIEGPLLRSDIDSIIETYRRIRLHSHYLVVLSILKGKFLKAFKISALIDGGMRGLPKIAEALGEANNYPLKLSHGLARRLGTKTLSAVLQSVIETERDLKGASRVNPDVAMETMLLEIASLLKK